MSEIAKKPVKGEWVVRSNHEPFRNRPVLRVQSFNPSKQRSGWYTLNGHFVIRIEFVKVVSEEEAQKIQEVWDNLCISVQLEPGLNSTCIREDNGKPKQQFNEENYKKALFKLKMMYPDSKVEAYKCGTCGHIHIGKVKPEIENQ